MSAQQDGLGLGIGQFGTRHEYLASCAPPETQPPPQVLMKAETRRCRPG